MITNSKVYDVLKFLAQVFLPAVGAAYFSLAGIWGLPSAEEVVGTIVIVDTFLGTVLQISSAAHANNPDGVMVVSDVNDKKTVSLELTKDPDALENKNEVRFKVVK